MFAGGCVPLSTAAPAFDQMLVFSGLYMLCKVVSQIDWLTRTVTARIQSALSCPILSGLVGSESQFRKCEISGQGPYEQPVLNIPAVIDQASALASPSSFSWEGKQG